MEEMSRIKIKEGMRIEIQVRYPQERSEALWE